MNPTLLGQFHPLDWEALDGSADWLVPQWPAPAHIKAFCTTRGAGSLTGPYASFNLATHVGDDALRVARNRAQFARAMDARPVFLNQVHGTTVVEVRADSAQDAPADGAFTRERRVACTVMVADCLPVLLCDTAGTTVAALHAGWRGLAGDGGQGVIEVALQQLASRVARTAPSASVDWIAWLGPCIGPQAFEVGDEVRAAFVASQPQAAAHFVPSGAGKCLANLPQLARQRLLGVGVNRVYGNDGTLPWCTVGNPSKFFSHRRDRISGRQAASIWLD
ncbi:MAG: peptidoglycan editing factor PgeF [Rhodoferax sp.]|nr:peptidoglycan editing factor PgeF [Rhodoferax sp.]